MRVTYRWLKDYVDIEIPPRELADRLTMAGFEIENLEPLGAAYTGVVTALIEKVEPHPAADKLTVCTVFDGQERLPVVCGAPNAEAGRIGALAKVGAVLPEGKIKRTKLRGVESFGMLCSRRELGHGDDHSGLWLLPPDTPLGVPLAQALGLDDWMFDIAVGPNRPDALSVIGLAREVAAMLGHPLRRPSLILEGRSGAIDRYMKVEIQAPDKCPRYTGILVQGIKISPSPEWMVHRLEAAGVRAINNIVDITNFVLLEYGQPLHAFDYHFIAGQKIIVRRAREGEIIVTLDEQPRQLTTDDLLICDGEKPVALAGIMGGLNSLITGQTVDVFIESAYFEPTGIRRSSRRLGLSSESSHRFERGIAQDDVPLGLHRAARLMEELAGGQVAAGYIDEHPAPRQPVRISVRPAKINALLGLNLNLSSMTGLLRSLELEVEEEGGQLVVGVPSFRVDLTREADLAEEIARLYGYDRLPETLHWGQDAEGHPWKLRHFLPRLRRILIGLGLTELVCFSFVDPKLLAAVKAPAGLRLANPLSEEMAVMRTSLLPGLLKTLAYNRARLVPDVQVFEARRVYLPEPGRQLPVEPHRLGLLMSGRRYEVSWNTPNDEVDFFDLKGVIEKLLATLSIAGVEARRPSDPGPYLPGVCAELMVGEQRLGIFGKVQADVLEAFELQGSVFAGELEIDLLAQLACERARYSEISKHPPIFRDIAMVADLDAPVDQMVQAITAVDRQRIAEVRVFDLYQGKGVPDGKKSVAFSLRYQDINKSLSDDDADRLTKRILQALLDRFGATLRE